MPKRVQEQKRGDACVLHTDHNMAHIYVIDCGVNDSRYNFCTNDSDKNDNTEFKLRVQRNKQNPTQTLVSGRDLQQVIKKTLIPPTNSSSLSSSLASSTSQLLHTSQQPRKMQYILQFANGRVVLPNEMLRDGDTVEVHRYLLQRQLSSRNRNKTKQASHDNIQENSKRKVPMSEHVQQSKQRQQKQSSLQQYTVPQQQQSKNDKSFHSENKQCDKAKSVILMSDQSDDDEDDDDKYSSENANASKENNRDISCITNSNCYDNDDNRENTCSNIKQMHAAKYINALRQSLAAARKRVQQLDDDVENQKQVLQEQVTKASWTIKREAQQKKNALQQQLANLQRQAVRIRAMQKRTRCATQRILDKMKNAQTSIDHDIVLLDNEMRKMLRIWQKCVEAHLAARCKQSSKIVGKENKSKQSIANERAVLQAQGVVLCRQLIASIAHTYVREMRQKLQHEWSSTRTMQTEQFGKTFAHQYSALPQRQHGDNVDATDQPNWPFTADSAHIVKVIARLRAPCSQLHIPQQYTRSRAGTASTRHEEIQDDNNDDDVIHKQRNAWADMQKSDEYEEIANEKKATVQVHVPTKGMRTFMLNAVYGPKHSNLFERSNQSDNTASLHKCNTNNNEQAKRTIFSSAKIDNQQIQQSQKLQQQQWQYQPKHQQQKRIFAEQLLPLILQLLFCANKHYLTVIAYGAKRSGKSYTLLGSNMDMRGQYGDQSERYIEQSNGGSDKVRNNSGRFYNRLQKGQLGFKNAMQRGITAVDANWVVNMNQKVKMPTSNNKSEETKVSAYSTAWQSAAQDAVSSREAMSTLRQQITRQLLSNTFGLRCCNWDGLLPQTLQFLLANLQSNRPHSNIFEHKCQITQIGVSACVVERTGVRDLFANYSKSDNNNEHHHHRHIKQQSLFIPHKTHKTSNTFNYSSPSSSSPSVKTFTTKVNRQNVSLQSINVRAVNDITLIMNTLKSVVKCGGHEKQSHNAGQTQSTESKNGSYTSHKDKSHDDHSKHSTTRITKQQTKNINTNERGTNDHKHLLVVVRCTLSIHDNINYKGTQNRKLQHTQTTIKNLNSKENDNGKSTKQVQLFFVEVAAGIDDTNKINGHLVKSSNTIQSTRTLTSIGNILYALNHSIKQQQKYDPKHEEKQTHKQNLLSWHATIPDDKCNNTSLSVINKQPVCRPMDSQSIFDEDPGKWWDVLRPLHGMTFTRVAPIIKQTQLFATSNTDHCKDSNDNSNSSKVTTSTSVTPDLANTLQQQKTQKCISSTPFVHSYQMRNNNNQNVAFNLSATQRSIILQGYANDTLTQLIRGGLTGTSRVLLIACLKPCVPCEVQLVTEDAKPLTLPSPHTIKGMEQIKEIITLLYNVQAPQMSAEAISTLTFAKRIMS